MNSSLPPKIIPNRIARESDFNINTQLAEPCARTGSAAMPPVPDTVLKEVDEEAPKQYVNILQQEDGEQQPAQAIPIEDATQQRMDEYSNQQDSQQISQQFDEAGGVQDKYLIQQVNLCEVKCNKAKLKIR
ncbi:MAG: hypothetical protein EZS28_015002 [Streblomastix strix]|uniref:Uncharacterized protein n=1 Tax=Streblomastix strix TaxID=222440 RepID=A0A5J4W3A6_9EUKA|nr:MAG: hypothetical protein EZS28_015002 [Streblomastix strix]